jgi:error-prone DNA polymerase
MTADYQVMALSTDYHPMQLIRPRLHEGIGSSEHLKRAKDGDELTLAGLATTRQRPESARGTVFMTLEDEFGKMDLIVQPGVYRRFRSLVRAEPFLIVRGVVQRRDQLTVHLVVRHLERLPMSNVAPTAHDMIPPPAHHFGQGSR